MFKLLEQYLKNESDLDQQNLELIFSKFKLLKTKRNQILLSYHEVCKHHYFVNKGCIRIFRINKAGQQTTRFFAFEGGFGTALPSLIDQQPAQEYLQTIEKSELLTIKRADFYLLVDTIPEFAKVYRNILELGFITAQKRIYGFQGFDAMEKVKWINTYYPKFLSRVSNKMAASYLGLSPSTLSRVKRKI